MPNEQEQVYVHCARVTDLPEMAQYPDHYMGEVRACSRCGEAVIVAEALQFEAGPTQPTYVCQHCLTQEEVEASSMGPNVSLEDLNWATGRDWTREQWERWAVEEWRKKYGKPGGNKP